MSELSFHTTVELNSDIAGACAPPDNDHKYVLSSVLVLANPDRSPEELIGWLAIGIGVAVNPGADGKYHGYTAKQLRAEARRKARSGQKQAA